MNCFLYFVFCEEKSHSNTITVLYKALEFINGVCMIYSQKSCPEIIITQLDKSVYRKECFKIFVGISKIQNIACGSPCGKQDDFIYFYGCTTNVKHKIQYVRLSVCSGLEWILVLLSQASKQITPAIWLRHSPNGWPRQELNLKPWQC